MKSGVPGVGSSRVMRIGALLGAALVFVAAAARTEPARPSCASCHAEIAAEWDASKHHLSATNASYVESLRREPLPFCRGCHAPAADPKRPTPSAAAQAGIGCTDCHAGLSADHVVHPDRTKVPAAKPCGGCHEFAFPRPGGGLMQATETEHKASAFASTPCAGCHLKPKDGHRDHRFDVVPLLAQAIVADVARASPTRVALRLSPNKIGHAFPTGDLFRRAVVRVTDGDRVVAQRYLARHFKTIRLPDGTLPRVDDHDDRVGAGAPACFELEAPSGEAKVEIALERVEAQRSAREADALVSGHLLVWERHLPSTVETYRPCP